ncbi:hypothetical protein F4802DRAFT_601985 [Xylaria palmicola]|nr:hypothetical protein F4802DRAFT_601985 [Xylaria palmicola]
MVEIMRISSRGQYEQYPSDAMDMNMDMTEISSRLMTSTLGSIRERGYEKGPKRDGDANNKNNTLHVPPRRAFTTSDYVLPTAPVSRAGTPTTSERELRGLDSYFPAPAAHLTPPRSPAPAAIAGRGGEQQQLAAVAVAPPRSYSVMDYEPVPLTHRPGAALQLMHLPAELHYAVFDFLDPIDSVCLALTSRHFYAVHWRLHGRVSLASRREGPNDMEWVWRHAGPFQRAPSGKQNALALLSPRGQVYCRKCRTARCELHKHIHEWMGGGVEYCLVTEKFGPVARPGAKGFCYRSSPRHPNRCGRHTRNQREIQQSSSSFTQQVDLR